MKKKYFEKEKYFINENKIFKRLNKEFNKFIYKNDGGGI